MKKLLPAWLLCVTMASPSIAQDIFQQQGNSNNNFAFIIGSPIHQSFARLNREQDSILRNQDLPLFQKFSQLANINEGLHRLTPINSPQSLATGVLIQHETLENYNSTLYANIRPTSEHLLAPYIEEFNRKTNDFMELSLPLPTIILAMGFARNTQNIAEYSMLGDVIIIDTNTSNEQKIELMAYQFAKRAVSQKFSNETQSQAIYKAAFGLRAQADQEVSADIFEHIYTSAKIQQECGLTQSIIAAKITDPEIFIENLLKNDLDTAYSGSPQEKVFMENKQWSDRLSPEVISEILTSLNDQEYFIDNDELQRTNLNCSAPYSPDFRINYY